MTISNFAFNPSDGLRNVTSFPTDPLTEADARNQPQTLLDQVRDKLNNDIIPAINAPVFLAPTGLTGATQTSRYVGATTSGAPITGTFQAKDWVLDGNGLIWACTVAGSPGTWVKSGGTSATLASGSYTGDGMASRTIPVGFRPKFLTIAASVGSVDFYAVDDGSSTNWMSDSGTSSSNAATVFTGMTSTGFTTGTGTILNTSGTVYKWVAMA